MSVENTQNILMPNEEAQMHWEGEIHIGEKTRDGEFLATTDRLIYDEEGMMSDISYMHISSVKSGAESREITTGGGFGVAIGFGIIFVLAGFYVFSGNGSPLIAILGVLFILIGGLLALSGIINSANTEVETTEKIIHHIEIMRDNERPLYLTTEKNVGPTLRNLVAKSKA